MSNTIITVEHTDKVVHYWYVRTNWSIGKDKYASMININGNTNPSDASDPTINAPNGYKTIKEAKKGIERLLKYESDFDSFDIVPFTDDNIIK